MALYKWNPKTRAVEPALEEAQPERLYIQGDVIEPTWHPCDQKYYESKSKFRSTTRAFGCVETEGAYRSTVDEIKSGGIGYKPHLRRYDAKEVYEKIRRRQIYQNDD